jgi:hypothetical protein
MRDENGSTLAYFHNILNRWEEYFSLLLNVQTVSGIRKIEKHTAELLITERSAFEFQIDIVYLKWYKSKGIKQIPSELIKQEINHYSLRSINSLIVFGKKKNCRP